MKSDAIRQMFCERHMVGVLYKDIAKELEISLRTASNWAEEMGLPRRTGGPRRQKWMSGKKSPKSDDFSIHSWVVSPRHQGG